MESDRAEADLGEAADIALAEEPRQEVKTPKKRFIGRKDAAAQVGRGEGSGKSQNDSNTIEGRSVERRLLI